MFQQKFHSKASLSIKLILRKTVSDDVVISRTNYDILLSRNLTNLNITVVVILTATFCFSELNTIHVSFGPEPAGESQLVLSLQVTQLVLSLQLGLS